MAGILLACSYHSARPKVQIVAPGCLSKRAERCRDGQFRPSLVRTKPYRKRNRQVNTHNREAGKVLVIQPIEDQAAQQATHFALFPDQRPASAITNFES